MVDAASLRPSWPRLFRLWFAWMLASALGGMLAPALSTRNQERLAGAYPWIVSAVAATLDLVVVPAVLVFLH